MVSPLLTSDDTFMDSSITVIKAPKIKIPIKIKTNMLGLPDFSTSLLIIVKPKIVPPAHQKANQIP